MFIVICCHALSSGEEQAAGFLPVGIDARVSFSSDSAGEPRFFLQESRAADTMKWRRSSSSEQSDVSAVDNFFRPEKSIFVILVADKCG